MFPGSQEGERCHLQPKTFPGSRGDHTIKVWVGTSLGVQGLRLQAPSAGGPDWIPGQGTRSHMSQLQITRIATRNWCSQVTKQKKLGR